jgi:exodeoxyribonuclease VII large subunit
MLYTVHELTQYVKQRLQNDPSLNNISVRGEISNFVHHTSGHMYFTMKDEHSQLSCVMFRGANQKLRFKPENGMKVVCGGNITVYEARGAYQLLVWDIQPDGIGALYQAFEQLKEQLSRRGFFDDVHKKPLPAFPETIGIVTSRTGAVLHDILNVIRRRFPGVRIILANRRSRSSLPSGMRPMSRSVILSLICVRQRRQRRQRSWCPTVGSLRNRSQDCISGSSMRSGGWLM